MAWVEALLLALIKHFVFVSCRECFVNTWIHYQVLWNQRTFIYIIYLFRIIPAIVRLLLHYDDDLVTRTDCGPEYAACATQHRDTCWIHAMDTCRSGVMVRAISSPSSANYASVGINFTHKQHGYLETCPHTLSSCSCCLNVDLLE